MTIKLGFRTPEKNYLSLKGPRTLSLLFPWFGLAFHFGARMHRWMEDTVDLQPVGEPMWGLTVNWGQHEGLGIAGGWYLYLETWHVGNWDPRTATADGKWRMGRA